jgi:hypothetical protein
MTRVRRSTIVDFQFVKCPDVVLFGVTLREALQTHNANTSLQPCCHYFVVAMHHRLTIKTMKALKLKQVMIVWQRVIKEVKDWLSH